MAVSTSVERAARAEAEMRKGPIQNVRRIIVLEDAVQEALDVLNDPSRLWTEAVEILKRAR